MVPSLCHRVCFSPPLHQKELIYIIDEISRRLVFFFSLYVLLSTLNINASLPLLINICGFFVINFVSIKLTKKKGDWLYKYRNTPLQPIQTPRVPRSYSIKFSNYIIWIIYLFFSQLSCIPHFQLCPVHCVVFHDKWLLKRSVVISNY